MPVHCRAGKLSHTTAEVVARQSGVGLVSWLGIVTLRAEYAGLAFLATCLCSVWADVWREAKLMERKSRPYDGRLTVHIGPIRK